ncbi:MAG: dethiobiotin synthetase, partial [Xanthomonadaceae bacterium]|nr:dethiobiotin synthetase [Xanthomonadaceae bacterium]
MQSHGFYVTGTDTGIGKTVVSVALLHVLRARGSRAIGMKPVASGCTLHAGDDDPAGWRNEDALALQAASDPRPRYAQLNPYALPLPLAPELAARDAGIQVELQAIIDAHGKLQAMAADVGVEGVGGGAAPLSAHLMQADVVQALDIPVVLVVGLRLGCLNHAILSAQAIAADGCRLVGWIGNAIDPHMERRDAHRALLEARIDAPCCGW